MMHCSLRRVNWARVSGHRGRCGFASGINWSGHRPTKIGFQVLPQVAVLGPNLRPMDIPSPAKLPERGLVHFQKRSGFLVGQYRHTSTVTNFVSYSS